MTTNASGPLEGLSAIKRALLAREVRDHPSAMMLGTEPIAIVGLACRFPGAASDAGGYWNVLHHGIDVVAEVPSDRWDVDALYAANPDAPGKMNTRWGGFVEGVDRFDAGFFGIAPREARRMDPQQRMLLEVAWEALESAAIAADGLVGSRTGVFVGISSNDYGQLQIEAGGLEGIDAYYASGMAHSIAAGRLSYALGLQGPSVALDTACSSSLVAVHLACQSLRSGESTLALAGGVNVVLAPEGGVTLAKYHLLAGDGRCKAFDARADGFVRGEGCGLVVLKRLSDALTDGDRLLALIRGSAINQDGRSTALTAPNRLAQQDVIRAALANAGIAPSDVSYVETHGTGTALGDPVEVEALAAVLGAPTPDGRPLLLGAAKTNLGHLESAAGVAGLIKVVLSLQHGSIPPNLHLETLNPHIALEGTRLEMPKVATDWPASNRPRRAGVSSFGFSGTNAHVVLEEAPRLPSPPANDDGQACLLPVSARQPTALRALAAAYGQRLTADDASAGPSLADLCATASTGRAHHEHRLAVVGASRADVAARLEQAFEVSGPGAARGVRSANRPRLAFIFSGQGPQWWAMGRQLLDAEPLFRSVIERCDALLGQLSGDWSLLAELSAQNEASARMERTDIAQPALFAIQVALSALWRSWGVVPDAVIGHSVGEIAAAHCAGALTLEDAIGVVFHRGRLMHAAAGGGGMVSIALPAAEVQAIIADYGEQLTVAAENGPRTTVVSGERPALTSLVATLKARDIQSRTLRVDYAFHSPQMTTFQAGLRVALETLRADPTAMAFVSTVTGGIVQGEELDAAYWARNLRDPVRFAPALRVASALGCSVFVEIGPHPVLGAALTETLGPAAVVLGSLRRGRDERASMLTAAGELYVRGSPLNWSAINGPRRAPVDLPSYPWQREHYWFTDTLTVTRAARPPVGPGEHPLLGTRLRSPAIRGVLFQSALGATRPAYLADHRALGEPILPLSAFADMALSAANRSGLTAEPAVLRDLIVHHPLSLPLDGTRTVQVHVERNDDGRVTVRVLAEDAQTDDVWRVHAEGHVDLAICGSPANEELSAIRARVDQSVPIDDHYAALARHGVELGPSFRGLVELWRGAAEGLGLATLPSSVPADTAGYGMHPALLDAALQPLTAAFGDVLGAGTAYLPVGFDAMRVHGVIGAQVWSHVVARPHPNGVSTLVCDVRLFDPDGRLLATIEGLHLKRVDARRQAAASSSSDDDVSDWLYELSWQLADAGVPPSEPAGSPARAAAPSDPLTSRQCLILADQAGLGAALAERLMARAIGCALLVDAFVTVPSEPVDVDDIVCLWGLDTPANGAEPLTDQQVGLGRTLELVHTLGRWATPKPPRLWLVTRGAQSVGGETGARVAPEQATLWGLGASVAQEYPELRCTRVDLDTCGTLLDGADALTAELLASAATSAENAIALRGTSRYVARLMRRSPASAAPAAAPLQLVVARRGVLDGLKLAPLQRRAPGPGEVEIRVRASGLNFRDVLDTLGMYPGGGGPLGLECAGEVEAVGAGVEGLRPGDAVLGIGTGAFATHMTTLADLVVHRPERLSPVEAATLPIAFLTAHYALNHLGGLRAQQRVLIHAAAGGVGLAAVQLAQQAGAEIFATAGSPAKRAFLRSLGVQHVADSRSLAFAEDVQTWTDGDGVDMVLNSLAGEFIPASLSVLATGGHFLEIGRTDVWTPAAVATHRPDARYSIVYLGDLIDTAPATIQAFMRQLLPAFASGALRPLPLRTYPIEQAEHAFRTMAQARHIGKLVLVQPPIEAARVTIRHNATYLVTGGFGALGRHVASWLVEQGARGVALVGRSAIDSRAAEWVRELERQGASIVALQADIARADDVDYILGEIERRLPPLRGIVHAAGVLDDGVLSEQTWARFETVLAPKLAGAWHLHTRTRHLPLDLFVLFSAAGAVIGSAGQANYSAANAFLDALARARRAEGLNALSIGWGAWSEQGMLAGVAAHDLARWTESGFGTMQPPAALRAMRLALDARAAHVLIAPIDWARRRLSRAPGSALSALLTDSSHVAPAPASGGQDELLVHWPTTPANRRRAFLLSHIRKQAIRTLGLPSDRPIAAHQALSDLGLDSLMAVELRNTLVEAVGCALPATLLFDYPTCESLADYLLTHAPALGESQPTQMGIPVDPEQTSARSERDQLADLTDAEVEALLVAELAEARDDASRAVGVPPGSRAADGRYSPGVRGA